MKTIMEKHVHDENCNHDHEDIILDEDEPGNLELIFIDN